jgi:hypothetical protein
VQEANPARPRRLTTWGIILPVASLAALLAAWHFDHLGLMIPIAVAAILAYALLPRLVRAREARFQKEALRLLATGRAAAVPELARRQLVLQLFGASGPVDAVLGLAHAQAERWPDAAAHLEPAVAAAAPAELPALRANLTKALFAIGDLARAREEGTALLETGPRLPETLALVARAAVGLGAADARVAALLDEAEAGAPSADVRTMIALTRVEAQLVAGRRAPELPESADSGQRLVRAWIHFARGRLRERRGDADGAAASYAKSAREAGEDVPLFAALAHARLGALAGAAPAAERHPR